MAQTETNTKALIHLKPADVVMREARERAEAEIARLRQRQHSPFRRFVAWRYQALMIDGFAPSESGDGGMLIFAAWVSLVQCVNLCGILFLSATRHTIAIGAFTIILVISSALHFIVTYFDKKSSALRALRRHLLRHLVLPIMPFLRIFDHWVLERNQNEAVQIELQIRQKEQQLAKLAAHEVVPSYYEQQLAGIREELLGDASPLRVEERGWQAALAAVLKSKEKLAVRRRAAKGNAELEAIYSPAMEELDRREACLRRAIECAQRTIAKTEAVLEMCAADVRMISAPLEAADFVQKISAGAERDMQALETAHATAERHAALVQDRLMRLAAIIAPEATPLLPGHSPESLEAYLARVERMGEQLAEIDQPATEQL